MGDQQPGQTSILLKLPAEVLHNIINQHEYPCEDDMFNFRLVCHAMNQVASHSALRVLRLSGAKARKMVSSPIAAFTQNTRALRLLHLQDRSLKESVCDVLKKLENVRTLQWEVGQPSKRILEVVGQLQHLERVHLLSLVFPGAKGTTAERVGKDGGLASTGSDAHLASYLVGLNSLVVGAIWESDGTEVAEQLQSLLEANPGLERFELRGSGGNCINFAHLIEGALERRNFQPSLRTLDLRSFLLSTTSIGTALRYLTNLTSLTASNIEPYHQELWKAFGERNIRLNEVTVEEPTGPMVDYLQTYRGLQYFCLKYLVPGRRWIRREPVAFELTEKIRNRLLHEALPLHSETLVDVRFAYPPDESDQEAWALDEDQLIWLQQFPKLEAVTVSCWLGHRGVRFISLQRALYGLLTELSPTVRSVRIVEHLWPTSGRKELEEFERMRFSKPIADPHRKELRYLGFRWHLVRDSIEEKYRFEMEDYGFLDNTNDSDVGMD